jgi:hypothetical protein
LRLVSSVLGDGGPLWAACIGGHWNPPYRVGFRLVSCPSVGDRVYKPRRRRQRRERARLGGTLAPHKLGRSSRTEGSSDLWAGQRQPPIGRSPSRIATTWSQVADQFTPRGQVSRAAFASSASPAAWDVRFGRSAEPRPDGAQLTSRRCARRVDRWSAVRAAARASVIRRWECSKLVGCTHPAFGAGSMISSASAEYLATSASTREPTSRWTP